MSYKAIALVKIVTLDFYMTLPKELKEKASIHAAEASSSPRDKFDIFMLAVEWLYGELEPQIDSLQQQIACLIVNEGRLETKLRDLNQLYEADNRYIKDLEAKLEAVEEDLCPICLKNECEPDCEAFEDGY